jgi:zinc transport system ATP-binding protein
MGKAHIMDHVMISLLDVQNLSFDRPPNRILEEVSLSITPGQIITVVGPNGAGKTTLVKIILGLLTPTSGKIRRKPQLRIGYMPQKMAPNTFLPLTVLDFLSLGRRGPASSATNHDLLRIDALLTRFVCELSGGEWQRVLLARALCSSPDLLILDEPTQGVDVFGQQDMYHLFAALRDRTGISLLIVSHDLHFVLRGSDYVLCLNRHICCSGTPETVAKSDEYHRFFPDLAPYTHHHNHRHPPCS